MLSRSSSFRTELLCVTTDDGEPALDIYFKDLHPRHQVTESWALRRSDRMPSRLEVEMYQSVLSPERFGTPEFYGSRWEPEDGRCWLFIEDVGDRLLHGEKDAGVWVDVCRWAARFHAATRDLPAAQTAFLPVYNERYYRRCAESAARMLPGLDAVQGDVVRRGLDYFIERIEWLSTLPRCVIHGQLFGKNVMLRRPRAAHRIAVIDWETAALGPGVYDLASISAGKRTPEQRLAMWRAYADEYHAKTGQSLEWERFHGELVATAVFHALNWLVYWSQHPEPSKRFPKFLRELDALLDGRTVPAAIERAGRDRG
jgi:hypothetical protein